MTAAPQRLLDELLTRHNDAAENAFCPVCLETSCSQCGREHFGCVTQMTVDGFFEALPCMALVERSGQIVARNSLALRLSGSDVSGSDEPTRVDAVLIGINNLPDIGRFRFDCLLTHGTAPPIPVSVVGHPGSFRGEPCRLLLLVERWEGFAAAIATERSFLEEVLDATAEATVIAYQNRILHVNQEFCRLFDYALSDCVGRELDDLVMPDGRLHESEMIMHTLRNGGRSAIDTIRRTGTGRLIDVTVLASRIRLGGDALGLFVVYRDISMQKQEEARLQYSVLHDTLTSLPNRTLFLDRVCLTLSRMRRRPDRIFSVIFLDLDGFKKVNDTFGHAAGDELLLTIATRLTHCLRPQDTVARFGGDEFAMLLDETGSAGEVEMVANRIQLEVQRPIPVAGSGAEAFVAASMGIVMASAQDADAEEILLHADSAMYAAKAAGKACHILYQQPG
jgi:diguanylate cyclase (GGDEF)-like protein/PAS domain S-box-containing protein